MTESKTRTFEPIRPVELMALRTLISLLAKEHGEDVPGILIKYGALRFLSHEELVQLASKLEFLR